MIFGQNIDSRDTVTSTQDIAREKALAGTPAGTVITAEFQTGGRGRQGRSWFAPHGANVCLTAIGPPVPMGEAWQIAIVAGIAVAEALEKMPVTPALTPRLRFPNDVTLGGKKVSGVLVETVPHPRSGYVTPLIGIGINVNVPADAFPEELSVRATSLEIVTGATQDKIRLMDLLFRRLDLNWIAFQNRPLDEMTLPRWRALADPAARRLFVLDGIPILCRVIDLAADGTVTLDSEDGISHAIPAAQVILGDA